MLLPLQNRTLKPSDGLFPRASMDFARMGRGVNSMKVCVCVLRWFEHWDIFHKFLVYNILHII